ncbi:MAG: NAD-dependent epimerase/dehydratase family protein [Silvibacterium sp.]
MVWPRALPKFERGGHLFSCLYLGNGHVSRDAVTLPGLDSDVLRIGATGKRIASYWSVRRIAVSGVLAKFTRQVPANETAIIWGDGEQSRDFTFIENVVHANLLAIHTPTEAVSGPVFNIATNSRITLNKAASVLRVLTGYAREVRNGPECSGNIIHSLADIRLAKRQLGYEVQVDFREGLRRTVEWYRKSEAFR